MAVAEAEAEAEASLGTDVLVHLRMVEGVEAVDAVEGNEEVMGMFIVHYLVRVESPGVDSVHIYFINILV